MLSRLKASYLVIFHKNVLDTSRNLLFLKRGHSFTTNKKYLDRVLTKTCHSYQCRFQHEQKRQTILETNRSFKHLYIYISTLTFGAAIGYLTGYYLLINNINENEEPIQEYNPEKLVICLCGIIYNL